MGIPAADGNSKDYEFGRSYYTVRSGDNLTTIAKATGFPISVIVEANNIKDPNKIKEGQKLVFVHESSWADPSSAWSVVSDDPEAWNELDGEYKDYWIRSSLVELAEEHGAQKVVQDRQEANKDLPKKMDTKW